MIVVVALIALVVGAALAFAVMNGKLKVQKSTYEASENQWRTRLEATENQWNEKLETVESQWQERLANTESQWKDKLEAAEKLQQVLLADERRHGQLVLESEQKQAKAVFASEMAKWESLLKQSHEERDRERENAEKQRAQSEKEWQLKFEALKKELLQKSSEQIIENSERLRQANTTSLNDLLAPIKDQFDAFRKSVEESATQNQVSKKEIQEKFESTLKLFQQQQDIAVRILREETAKIGNDAVSLAKALKSNTKRQGNWGEMVLQTMLENSGLEENVHFFTQYHTKDDEGRTNIPDVVIKFPEGRSVIVDSKVSLTAYTQYFETDDEERQAALLREHLRSVEKHIDELSLKNYPRWVEDSMDYVLMFIPNESSYVAAVKLNPNLLHDAYEKKVIVISPNNLMMALQLAYNLWQSDKQIRNVEKIVDRGRELYAKVKSVQESFDAMGTQIGKLKDAYDKARGQLLEGRGNVLRQCVMLQECGVTPDPKKKITLSEADIAALESGEE